MIKMVIAAVVIFAMVFGGFFAVKRLDVFELHSLIKYTTIVSLVAICVMFLVAAIVILF